MNKRVGFLDEIRGFAIICMVIYHIMFDLKFIFGVDVPIFFEDWFYVIRDIFAGMFIFISGSVCQYSKSNLKRGVQCFFLGMVITFVTGFVSPDMTVYFGILHCLGICMMIYGLFENVISKIPAFLGLAVFVFLFVATINIPQGYLGIKDVLAVKLPSEIYSAGILFPFGFTGLNFASSDYFPLFPWMFLFFAGAFFGVFVKEGYMPKFFYNTHIPFLAATGRYTIWIYILHQPIVYVVLSLIFNKPIF